MRWLKSTTQKTYTANGKLIPACVTPRNEWLKVTEPEYHELKSIAVIASLIKAGGILVTTKEPAELRNSLEGLKDSNAELIARNTQLEEEIKQLKSTSSTDDVEAVKKEARQELKDKQKALDDAKAEIERLQQLLAEKDAE
jgi:predicted RNase H-like nuclease (RuvC/YqgF family)